MCLADFKIDLISAPFSKDFNRAREFDINESC
jgi:hypothetical protein